MTNDEALALIERLRDGLSARQRHALRLMCEAEQRNDLDGAELVYEHGEGWVGLERFSGRTVMALLRACTLKRTEGEAGGYEVFRLTTEGRAVGENVKEGK